MLHANTLQVVSAGLLAAIKVQAWHNTEVSLLVVSRGRTSAEAVYSAIDRDEILGLGAIP